MRRTGSILGLVLGTIAVLVAVMRGPAPAAAEGSSSGQLPALVGTWLVTLETGSQLLSFRADGTAIRAGSPVRQLPEPAQAALADRGVLVSRLLVSTGYGTWARTGEHEFAATTVALLFDDEGTFIATRTTHIQITLDPGGNRFIGQDVIVVADAAGNPFYAFEDDGPDVEGVRIETGITGLLVAPVD